MPKIKIVNDYMNLRKGDILDIADVGEGVTQIYESRDIAVRVPDDTLATKGPDEDAPSEDKGEEDKAEEPAGKLHTRRISGPREK